MPTTEDEKNKIGIKERALYLTQRQTKTLFAYYFLTFISSFICALSVFIPDPLSTFNFLELALIGSSSMACLGSTIYYTRKLYKSVLSDLLVTCDSHQDLKAFATFIYFFARPLFSIAFALLVVIGVKSGLVLSGGPEAGLNYGFVQLTMFVSFFVGFLAGRFLRQLESWGERILEQVSSGGMK